MDPLQPVIEPAHDVISLPSGGKFYKNKKSTLKVAYLTAADENILTSPNLLQNGKVIDVLLEKKILDKDLRPAQMLSGDKNAVLFFLRATGYGEKYPVELIDPKTKQPFETEIDISQFQAKENALEPDENGECRYTLPKSKDDVKFRYLTADEDDKIIKEDEARRKKMGQNAISQIGTMRLTAHIMEVGGIRDKSQIQKYVDEMSPLDSGSLRKYISDNEPALDLNIQVEAPSGDFFSGNFQLPPNFFGPTSTYEKDIMYEFYILIKYGGFTYNDLLMMPVYKRRGFLDIMNEEREIIKTKQGQIGQK